MIKRRPHQSSTSPQTTEPAPATTAAPPLEPALETGMPGSKGLELGDQIGQTLKAMFDDVVAEPVPEKFRQLLEQLERKSDKT